MTKLIIAVARRVSRTLNRKTLRKPNNDHFDPVYYVRRYPDLGALDSTKAVRRHFENHGRDEGRFPNATAEAEALYHIYLSPSEDFDLRAYKALNPDLRGIFQTDRDYILHYIRHGKTEGRPCTFETFDSGGGILLQSWAQRLSVSQFSAWASDWLDHPPKSRRDVIAVFDRQGIDRLAPLRFDLVFDPSFYRRHYAPGSKQDDVALYRRWLDGGEDRNEAPNEGQFLKPFIGESPFPPTFDWSGYASAARLPNRTDRAAVLACLFESERDPRRVRQFVACGDWRTIENLVLHRLNRGRLAEADAMLAAWQDSSSEWPASIWILRGDIDARLGKLEQARDALSQAVNCGDRSFQAVKEVTRLELAMRAPERAVAWLREQRRHWAGSAEFEQLAALCIDRWFESLSATGHQLLSKTENLPAEAEQVAEFNAHMHSGLAAIADAIDTLEPEPAHLEPAMGGHVALLGNEDLHQCTHYRLEQKQEQFALAGIELRRHAADQISPFIVDLLSARAAIFYRVAATPAVIRAILTARRMGIPTYYEIDDLLFDPACYPPPYDSYQERVSPSDYGGLRFGVPLFQFALSLCDNAIASTPALLKRMAPITRNGRGILVRNGLDSRNELTIDWARRLSSTGGHRVRIFYGSGTLAHNIDFTELAAPALMRLMMERSDVDLVTIGHVALPDSFSSFDHRIMRLPPTSDITGYWSILAACDINIAVLKVAPAADCKSEIKWLEAAMLGIPSVVSGTHTYRDVISPGKDGLIADSPDQWYQSLVALVDGAALRQNIGAAAREKALTCYSLEGGATAWRKEFSQTAPARTSKPAKLRVLVCNVFFAPQSIGGATRVAEENVAHIASHHPDIELAVFCTDEGASEVGRLRTSRFGEVPVFRLVVPTGRDIEAEIFSESNAAAFCKVVELFRPDIIHFHCIQRLTASIVQAARDMAIPYLVTLHDAWWLSPHQFLVDRDGFLRMPTADPLAGFADYRSTNLATIRRRQALDPLLLGADRILTVSDSFAEVYRSAGIDPVAVIANGVPDLPAPIARSPIDGPLRLAHIGGRAGHKGADLVEAALRLGNFPDFHLLMIDGHLPPGKRIESCWGQTPVTISAPLSQGDVAGLYAGMDVLLAPSRWPESFGLVAREALHFGVWVVASRLGAMGDDVIEGQNGFLIDTANRTDLDRVLARLHAESDRFRQGMAASVGRLRTSTEQADELVTLYRELGRKRRAGR